MTTTHSDHIAIIWHIDDVRYIRPDLSDEACREVLEFAERKHDADLGINWMVLETAAETLYPAP